MNEDEKRELAKHLLPHLAWDLSRSSVYSYEPNETTSGTQAQMFIEQIVRQLQAKVRAGESFSVAIIPARKQ